MLLAFFVFFFKVDLFFFFFLNRRRGAVGSRYRCDFIIPSLSQNGKNLFDFAFDIGAFLVTKKS